MRVVPAAPSGRAVRVARPVGSVASGAIHPTAAIGTVRLTVADLDRSRTFYERAIGLRATELEDGSLSLGLRGERPLIELRGEPYAPPIDRRAPGLYHLAILVPTRVDLAVAVTRLVQARWPLSGAADHLVSEALYLSDPDGNGIEIYRDRSREQWPRVDDELELATLPLDLDELLGELTHGPQAGLLMSTGTLPPMPAGTRVGHVHLQVAELADAEAFYSGVLGFEVMVRTNLGALFLSAGGYHHHIGLNTWHSARKPPPPPGSIGLRSFEVLLPDAAELDRVLARVSTAGTEAAAADDGVLVRDPSGNAVVLRVA